MGCDLIRRWPEKCPKFSGRYPMSSTMGKNGTSFTRDPSCLYRGCTRKYLKEHIERKHNPQRTKQVPCPVCGKLFYHRKYVKVHLKNAHLNWEKSDGGKRGQLLLKNNEGFEHTGTGTTCEVDAAPPGMEGTNQKVPQNFAGRKQSCSKSCLIFKNPKRYGAKLDKIPVIMLQRIRVYVT